MALHRPTFPPSLIVIFGALAVFSCNATLGNIQRASDLNRDIQESSERAGQSSSDIAGRVEERETIIDQLEENRGFRQGLYSELAEGIADLAESLEAAGESLESGSVMVEVVCEPSESGDYLCVFIAGLDTLQIFLESIPAK